MIKIAPFKSQKQRAYFYSQLPELAKEWEAHTPKGKKLPKYAPKKKKKKKTKADYYTLIIKTAMSVKDYFATHLNAQDRNLLINLPHKNDLGVASWATQIVGILNEYRDGIAHLMTQKKSNEDIKTILLNKVQEATGQDFEKIKWIAEHIALKLISEVGFKIKKAALVERAKNPVKPIGLDEEIDKKAEEKEFLSLYEQGIGPEDPRFAFRKIILRRISKLK